MHCGKCGTLNSEDSHFCKKCGSPIGSEVETRLAPRSPSAIAQDDEKQLFSVNPTLKFVMAGYLLTVISAFLVVAFFSVFLPGVSSLAAVIAGLALLVVPAYFHIRKKLVRYTLTEAKLELDEGLISRTTTSVPLRRVQDVTVRMSIPQRLLGFGDIIVDNAGTDGQQVILRDIDSPRRHADILMKQIKRAERHTGDI
jgi:uncharacterized membrane protein YdbT with pleckstrin-like domain